MGLSAAAKGLRSFQGAKASELRIKWTAGLTGSGIDGFNCARKAVQSTDDGNQNIVQPPIARHRRLSARIWPLLFAQSKAPTLPCIHRLESTTQEYTALFFTRPSSRI